MSHRNLYLVLQVQETAEADVIRAAFRALARRYHPDAPDGSVERMAAINDAWSVLGDERRRAAYDAELVARRARMPRSTESGLPFRPGQPDAGPSPADMPPMGPPAAAARPDRPAAEPRTFGGFGARTDDGAGPLAKRRRIDGDASPMLDFGRYSGWSLAMVAKQDPDYLEWLARTPVGRSWRSAIDDALRSRVATAV